MKFSMSILYLFVYLSIIVFNTLCETFSEFMKCAQKCKLFDDFTILKNNTKITIATVIKVNVLSIQ